MPRSSVPSRAIRRRAVGTAAALLLVPTTAFPAMAATTPGPTATATTNTAGAPDDDLSTVGRLLLDALGLPYGTRVDNGDLLRGAQTLGVDVGRHVDPADVERMVSVHRQGAAGVLDRLGITYGTRVDGGDIARAARRLELDTGAWVDPTDVSAVVAAGTARLQAIEARQQVQAVRARAQARAAAPFAHVAGVELVPPSREVRLIGMHQASSSQALEMAPASRTDVRTLPSRGRGTPRHSAADVAVVPHTAVLSPVTGRVVDVRRYLLYGRTPDLLIRIVPDDAPHLAVKVLHTVGARVDVGDRVVAGETPVANEGRQLPFVSQIDRFAGNGPHVHVEVGPR